MSKKNKKKLRRILRARAIEQAQTMPNNTPSETVVNISDQAKPAVKNKVPDQIVDDTNEEAVRVKHEIARILITMGAIIIVIIGVYLINQKTDWVLQAGKSLTSLLNINL
jgi:hypothetical protein